MTRHCHHFARPQKQEALETINIGKAVASPDIQYAILPGDHGHGFTRVEQAAAIDLVKLRRSEEHTSELQSLMRISYAVFCLNNITHTQHTVNTDNYHMTHYTNPTSKLHTKH